MKIRVRYFASLREALGEEEFVDIDEGASVAQLRDALIARGDAHAQSLARQRAVRAAIDRVMCDEAARLHSGAEVAFFPPVTGG